MTIDAPGSAPEVVQELIDREPVVCELVACELVACELFICEPGVESVQPRAGATS